MRRALNYLAAHDLSAHAKVIGCRAHRRNPFAVKQIVAHANFMIAIVRVRATHLDRLRPYAIQPVQPDQVA